VFFILCTHFYFVEGMSDDESVLNIKENLFIHFNILIV
jgi:hypothetical protein